MHCSTGTIPAIGPVQPAPYGQKALFNQHYTGNMDYSIGTVGAICTIQPALLGEAHRTLPGGAYCCCCCCCCCCCHFHINSHNQVRGHRTGPSHSGAEEYPREKNTNQRWYTHISQLTQFMPPPETFKSEIGSQRTMYQVHTGAYVSLLAPDEKTAIYTCTAGVAIFLIKFKLLQYTKETANKRRWIASRKKARRTMRKAGPIFTFPGSKTPEKVHKPPFSVFIIGLLYLLVVV